MSNRPNTTWAGKECPETECAVSITTWKSLGYMEDSSIYAIFLVYVLYHHYNISSINKWAKRITPVEDHCSPSRQWCI